MSIETIPQLTKLAAQAWSKMQPQARKQLLSNVWCVACRDVVTIVNFRGFIKGGDLILKGSCAACGGGVVRVIEKH